MRLGGGQNVPRGGNVVFARTALLSAPDLGMVQHEHVGARKDAAQSPGSARSASMILISGCSWRRIAVLAACLSIATMR